MTDSELLDAIADARIAYAAAMDEIDAGDFDAILMSTALFIITVDTALAVRKSRD